MPLPHRSYSDLAVRTLVGHSDDNAFNAIGKFTNDHIELGHYGWFYEDTQIPGLSYWKWHVLVKSISSELSESLDQAIDYGAFLTLTIDQNNENCGQFALFSNTMRYPELTENPITWDKDLVTGKRFDGVQPWAAFPPHGGYEGGYQPTLQWADAPHSLSLWIVSFDGAARGNQYAPTFLRNGLWFEIFNIANCDNPWTSGDILDGFLEIYKLKINFLNPVVNSMSRKWIRVGQTPNLVLTGLGFDQDDVELNDPARNPLNAVGAVWASIVDEIDFIGEQGQGTFNLNRALGDFTCDSDSQITIQTMPNLPEGTYQIRLFKNNVGPGGVAIDVYSYAGDFKCDIEGLCVPASRFSLVVSAAAPKKNTLLFLTNWKFKKGENIIDKYFAPIDIRSNNRFYDGRIIAHSALTKSVDDETGLPNISDITVDLANADKEFSKALAEYTIKNQIVALYSAWMGEPENWKEYFMQMIVDDWDLQGPILRVTLKDISQKYFRVSIPRYIITLDDYPNAHDAAVGKPMPEIIGKAYYNGDTLKGAVEAHYVDTVNHKYLAARGSLHSITQVYSENVLQVLGVNYTISYEDGGRTYINFAADQGDNKITFNCCGYMLGDWNSANGYVQNPAYVIAFFLTLIAEVPITFLDVTSFDELADLMEVLGWDEAAYLILQDFQDMSTALSELLFTFGAKIFPDIYGRFKIERKDKHSYETSLRIYDQIDTMEATTYLPNLRELVNRIKSVWGYYPCQSLFVGSAEDQRLSSINTYDVETESDPSPLEFKWTDFESIVIGRIGEELLKKGHGNKKSTFAVSTNKINELDILRNFQLQDLFALDIDGEGAEGHYYYVESMGIDLVNCKIDILAPDLQWLVRQCMIIGQCSELAEQWPDASDWMRLYGYVAMCLNDKFSDDEPAKTICICG